MRDEEKAKAQLLSELRSLRQELEALKASNRSEATKRRDEGDAARQESKEDLAQSRKETAAGLEQLGSASERLRRGKADLAQSRRETTAGLDKLVSAGKLRRKGESDLAESEKRNKILGDLIPFGVWASDTEGNITYLSDSYMEMAGVPLDDPSNLNWVARLSPEEVKNAVSDWQSSLDTMEIWEREHKVTGSDGREYTLLSRGVPVVDKQGKPLSWFGINIDISHRKALEEQVKEQAREYRTLVERLPKIDAARFDELSRFKYASPGAVRAHGISSDELVGRRPSETALDRKFARILEDAVEKVFESGQEASFRYTFKTQNGQVHRAYTLVLEHEAESLIRSVLQTSYDVTDLITLDEQWREALDEAERANNVTREFLANMSHEIRTPMNGVIGMTDLALREDIPERARQFLHMVKQSGQNLLGIINDILDLSKIEAGKTELEKHPLYLRETVESTIKCLRVNAEKKGLEFLYSFDPELSDRVEGDSGRFRQILTNIVGNAVKFTEQGRVAISMSQAEALSPESVHVLFMVKDDGIGIPQDKLLSIFNPFAQVGGSAHAKYRGTGLGLSISKELVELMGGKIWVESEPGQGSTFYFTVVFGLVKEKSEPPQAVQPEGEQQAWGFRILLAEDNLVNRIFAVELLQMRGHQVEAVENGREALEKLRQEKFDLVLMDVSMPEMGGEEATRRIRAGEAGDPAVPIVALTAHALKGDRHRVLLMGMDDYIAKPIDLEELDKVLVKVMARRAAGEPHS